MLLSQTPYLERQLSQTPDPSSIDPLSYIIIVLILLATVFLPLWYVARQDAKLYNPRHSSQQLGLLHEITIRVWHYLKIVWHGADPPPNGGLRLSPRTYTMGIELTAKILYANSGRGAKIVFFMDGLLLGEIVYDSTMKGHVGLRESKVLESRWWYLNILQDVAADVLKSHRTSPAVGLVYSLRWEGQMAYWRFSYSKY